jgi:hypothetical protein
LEPHLCPDVYECQICGLKKVVGGMLNDEAGFRDEIGHITEELTRYKERYGELPIQSSGVEQIYAYDFEAEQEIFEEPAEEEPAEEEPAEEEPAEEKPAEEESVEEEEPAEEGYAEGDPNAREYAIHRAQSAELENGSLRVEIARLKRENKDLCNKLSTQRDVSRPPMTQVTSASLLVGNTPDEYHSPHGHPKHERGGNLRQSEAPSSRSQPLRKVAGATVGETSGRNGHAKTMKNQENTAKKRQRDTYDEDWVDDDDADEQPSFKRHGASAKAPGRAVEDQINGRKTAGETCGPNKLAQKKRQESPVDSTNESFKIRPQSSRSRISRNGGRSSVAQRTSQTIAKTGRRTNNSQAGFLDTVGLNFLPFNSRDTPDVFGSGSAPSNTMSGFMDDGSDVASSETPEATFYTTAVPATTFGTSTLTNTPQTATTSNASTITNLPQLGTTVTTSTAVNPAQAAITLAAPAPANTNTARVAVGNRRAQGWSNAELQALIALMRAHRNAPVGPNGQAPVILHDVRLFQLMSRQLAAQGIHRTPGACKNEWNRRGRQLSGIDNRKFANPSQMATSLQ